MQTYVLHKYCMYRVTLQSTGGPYFLFQVIEDTFLHDAHLRGQRGEKLAKINSTLLCRNVPL